MDVLNGLADFSAVAGHSTTQASVFARAQTSVQIIAENDDAFTLWADAKPLVSSSGGVAGADQ